MGRIEIEKTPENEEIRSQIQEEVIEKMRRKINRFLDSMEM